MAKKSISQKKSKKIGDWLTGAALIEYLMVHIGKVGLIAVLILTYVIYQNHARSKIHDNQLLKKQLKEVRSQEVNTQADYMRLSKRSEVTLKLKSMGSDLEDSEQAPYRIKVNESR